MPCRPKIEIGIDLVVGRRVDGAHLAPVGIEFLGNQVASPVKGPCPNSICLESTVTVSSGPILTKALSGESAAPPAGTPDCVAAEAFGAIDNADDQAGAGEEAAAGSC